MKKIPFYLLILVCLSLAAGTPAWAVSLVSQEITERAKKFYEEGDYARAVHEFSKALLVDRTNKEALGYLNEMGIETGIYGSAMTPQIKIGEMAEDIQGYQQVVSDLEQQNSTQREINQALEDAKGALQMAVVRRENEKKALRGEIADIQKEADGRMAQIQDLNKSLKDKGGEIVRLHTNLYDMKGRLVTQTKLAREKDQVLKGLGKEYRLARKDWQAESRKERMQYEERFAALERDRTLIKTAAMDAENQRHIIVQNLQDTIHEIRQSKDETQEQLELTSQDLSFLEKKLIHKNKKIAELDASLKALEKELSSARSRSKKELALQKRRQKQDAAHHENIRWLEYQDAIIRNLKEELVKCRKDIRLYRESPLDKKEQRLMDLRAQLLSTKDELKDASGLLKEKTAENEILGQRLADTQQRLGLVEDLLQEKEGQLKELEEQLTGVLDLPE